MSRSTISEIDLDRSNDVWRTTPLYQEEILELIRQDERNRQTPATPEPITATPRRPLTPRTWMW